MWKAIFGRPHGQQVNSGSGGGGTVARPGRLARWLIGGLKAIEGKLSNGQKRVVFGLYVAAFGAGCLLAITSPFRGNKVAIEPVEFGSIAPAINAYSGSSQLGFEPDSFQQQITSYWQFLDSMRTDPVGKSYYDSLVKAQPGFIDTLQNVASYLQSLKQ